MRWRLGLLRQHGLKLADIQRVIGGMAPLPGAKDFLDGAAHRSYQVVILSDTFYEFADPLMAQLGRPTLLCHKLVVDADGFVVRLPCCARRTPSATRCEALEVAELPRLRGRRFVQRHRPCWARPTRGFFIHPPESIVAQFPQFAVHRDYDSLRASIDAASRSAEV